MNDNLEPGLFDPRPTVVAFARRDDPDTSREAADFITPRVRELQVLVLEYAEQCEPVGFCDPAMNAHFETHSSTYRTRRAELVDMGMVRDTLERRCVGESNRKHAVWRITPRGQATLQAARRDRAA